MSADLRRRAPDFRRGAIPSALVALGIALVSVAPTERTLGDGIRWVYVHVGLVWAGTLGLGVAAALGAAACATGLSTLGAWTWATWRAGMTAFALGVAFSMVAARVNWGAVFLEEPRMAASLRFLALAAILQVIAGWIAHPRITGALAIATLALLVWLVGGAELVLHPRDPVRTATSAAIQGTFAASFVLATALTSWTALRFGRASDAR